MEQYLGLQNYKILNFNFDLLKTKRRFCVISGDLALILGNNKGVKRKANKCLLRVIMQCKHIIYLRLSQSNDNPHFKFYKILMEDVHSNKPCSNTKSNACQRK